MAEEPQKNPPPDPPKTDPPAEPPKSNGPEPVPYERFKEVNAKNKQLETQLSDLQKQLKDKEDEGKSEIEKLTERIDALTKSQQDAEAKALRLEVAQKQGIPVELVDRLQGSTAEELTQDAERIKAFLKPSEGPGAPRVPVGGNPTKFSLENKTPEEIRQAHQDGKIKLLG